MWLTNRCISRNHVKARTCMCEWFKIIEKPSARAIATCPDRPLSLTFLVLMFIVTLSSIPELTTKKIAKQCNNSANAELHEWAMKPRVNMQYNGYPIGFPRPCTGPQRLDTRLQWMALDALEHFEFYLKFYSDLDSCVINLIEANRSILC